jgi:hypothetical protein
MLLGICLLIALGLTIAGVAFSNIFLSMISGGFWLFSAFAAYTISTEPATGVWDIYYGMFFLCIFVGAFTGIFETRYISKKNRVASDSAMPAKVSTISEDSINDEEIESDSDNYAAGMERHRAQYNKLHTARKKERKWRA